jgi:hypothetical protein
MSARREHGAALADAVASGIVRLSGVLLRPERREWVHALRSELAACASPSERLQLALMGSFGVFRIAAADVWRDCAGEPPVLAAVFAASAVVAAVDATSAGRLPLYVLLPGACCLAALLRPRAAALWGLLLGLGVPALALVSDFRGPYAHDRGDVWFGLVPALLISLLAGRAGRRLRR